VQAKPTESKLPTGIIRRHSRQCGAPAAKCTCKPSYRAWVFDRRVGEKIYKTFPTLAAAKQWRNSAADQLVRGKRIAQSRQTLAEASKVWLDGITADPPTILNRSDRPYKGSAAREYKRNLENYLLPELGAHRLTDIRRGDLQVYAERLRGKGLSGSKIRNIMLPLRVIFKHEILHERVSENPTIGLKLPNGSKARDRAATPTEATELLAALPVDVKLGAQPKPGKKDTRKRQPIRSLYATAFYAGLRRGELLALRWDRVDLAGGVIRVDRAWDEKDGEVEPKSNKGTRTVPIVALLRDYLTDLKASAKPSDDDFVFGRDARLPFTPSLVRQAAADAWEAANEKRAKPLDPIGLHECRHTYVSILADARIPLEMIGDYVGHSSTYMTDRYRHLLEGHETETARIVDEYLARADTAARLEQLGPEAGA
jgi:integrase